MTDPGAAPAAAPVSRALADPAKLLYHAPIARTIVPALIAIGIAWGISIVFNLVYLVRNFLWMTSDGLSYLGDAFGDFGEGAFLHPLLFFVGTGALVVLLLPIVAETKLLTVVFRAALAGVGGFVLLTLKGLIEAIVNAVSYGSSFGYFVNTWIGYPLVVAFDLVALFVIGAVLSWILLSRKTAPAPAA